MYGFTNVKPITDILVQKALEKVQVNLILDNQGPNNPENKDKDGNQIGFPEKTLEENGAVVKWDKRSYLMHRKALVVDEDIVFIGSTNWTQNGLYKNREIDLCIHDPEIAKQIIAQFELDFVAPGVVDEYTDVKEPEEPEPPKEDEPKPPQAPSNLRAKWDLGRIFLDWDAPINTEDIEGYNAYKALDGEEFTATPINTKPIKAKQTNDTDIVAGKTYKYKITSVGKNGLESEPSNIVTFEVPIKLVAVSNLKATKEGETVVITWSSSLPVFFLVKRNTTELGKTDQLSFVDLKPLKEKITYKVYPVKGSEIGPMAQVTIDLTEKKEPPPPPPPKEAQYIGNKDTKKFHKLTCRYVKEIKPENKVEFHSKEEATKAGYTSCGVCKP